MTISTNKLWQIAFIVSIKLDIEKVLSIIKHTLYSQYKDDWILINAEDYETFQAMKKQTIQKETAKSEGTEIPVIKHNNTISINAKK